MGRHLKIKLIIIQLISILPFLIFIFYLSDLWYDSQRSLLLSQNIDKTNLINTFVQNYLRHGTVIFEALTEDTLFRKTLSRDPKAAGDILKTTAFYVPEVDNIVVTDQKGQVLSSSLNLSAEQEKITVFDRPYFQKVLREKKATLSDPIIGRFSNKWIAVLASPILEEDKVVAVIVTSLDLEQLKKEIEESLENNGEKMVVLLDSQRQIVFTLGQPFPKESQKNLLADLPFVKKAKEGQLAIFENQELPMTRKPVIGVAVPMEEADWVVVSFEQMENIFAPLFKIQSLIWAILFVSLLFAISVITYFLRKVRVVY